MSHGSGRDSRGLSLFEAMPMKRRETLAKRLGVFRSEG